MNKVAVFFVSVLTLAITACSNPEASKIEDLKERRNEFSSVMEYFVDFDDPAYIADLKESVEKELSDIQVKVEEQ